MKFIKSKLFIFILGGIFFSSITAFAVTKISADKVTYTDKNNVERTVDVVLDDLYNNINKDYNIIQYIKSASSQSSEIYVNINDINNVKNYKYFKINTTLINGTGSCIIKALTKEKQQNGSWDDDVINENQLYTINDYMRIALSSTKTSGSTMQCKYIITLTNN